MGSGVNPRVEGRASHRLECPEHHQSIDIAERGMAEGERQAADNLESKRCPEMDGRLVRADDQVELHASKAARTSIVQRMLAHVARHASAMGFVSGDVATIGDMTAASGLVRSKIIEIGRASCRER